MLDREKIRRGGAARAAPPARRSQRRGEARGLPALRLARSVVGRVLRPPVVLRDEYLDWLLLANAGMQVPGNLQLFDLAVAQAPPAPMLEIGSFCGLSANIIAYMKARHGRSEPLFTCDAWHFEGAGKPLPEAAPVDRRQLREYVIESFELAVRTFSPADLPYAVEASSDDFFAMWDERRTVRERFGREVRLGGPLGFAFIDGNHSEEFAGRDFLNCDRHLLPGGLLLFDDSDDAGDWEVRRVIARVKRSGRYEVVAKNPNYLFRKLR